MYSREFLQNIPDQRKQATIDQIVQSFIQSLQDIASSGKTSYFYEFPISCYQIRTHYITGQAVSPYKRPNVAATIIPTWQYQHNYPVLSLEDVIEGLKKKFPDCKVSYEETWIEDISQQTVGKITKTMKKGITIDWS
jgi:hypothetical protein